MREGGRARGRGARPGTFATGAAVSGVAATLLLAACSSDPGPVRGIAVPRPPATSTAAPAPAPEPVPEYVLAEPERRTIGTRLPLDGGAWGVILDGQRVIATEAGVTVASEVADAAFSRVERIPARLGGGFLFRTSDALYVAAAFDGALRPVVTVPSSIASVSFGPDAVLVRGSDGGRWVVDLATGSRKAPSPIGLVDVAALDDGRAIAATEAGGAQLSLDGGKTWQDARAQLRGAAGRVFVRGGDLWIEDVLAQSTRTLRIDAKGAFADVGPMPPEVAPLKPDPRFRSGESPLRAALRAGARVGPWTAAVAAGGDVMRVDLHSGAIASTIAGVVPQNMQCEAVTVPDDVLFVCVERGKASAIVSGVLRGQKPRVERSFTADGPFFYVEEEGTIAFGGPCTPPQVPDADAGPAPSGSAKTKTKTPPPPPAAPLSSACVRNADGQWEPFGVSSETDPDAARPAGKSKNGPAAASASAARPQPTAPTAAPAAATATQPRRDVLRWIPRAGRPPVVVLQIGKDLATYDAAWGEHRVWQLAGHPNELAEAIRRHAAAQRSSDRATVDRRWAATAKGGVRALLDDGRAVEISPEGTLTLWPFTFARVAVSGARALARSNDGRAFQTLDHGHSWAQVAAPPLSRPGTFEPHACSALGCDAGAWLRLGWEPSVSGARPEPIKVQRPPAFTAPPLIELTCLATGSGETRAVPASMISPQDFGIGAARAPFDPDRFETAERFVFARMPVNVPFGSLGGGEAAPRALLVGHRVFLEASDRLDRPFGVLPSGPAAATLLKKELQFVEPLVPASPIRRVTFTMDAAARAAKGAGAGIEQLVAEGNFEVSTVVPITPLPAPKARAAPNGDVIASFTPTSLGTLFLIARGGAAPRADLVFTRSRGLIQSAAYAPGGDVVALLVSDEEGTLFLRIAGSTVTEVAAVPPTSQSPANPDAVALGPKGDIAVLRTPSGSEPPTAADPALLILPGGRLVPLAPWSTAASADSADCASDTAGFRATIQTTVPWARIAGRPSMDDASLSGMTARVRWSPARVCIEAIETPESQTPSPSFGMALENIVVATFGPNAAGRATIELGSESRVPLSCALQPR